MAVVGRQVFDWHRLIPLTWALVARRTPHLGEQKRTAAFLLRKLTTASSGGGLEDSSFAEPRKYVQEPECRTRLVQHLLEKQRTAVEREVTSPLLDMGFSEVHVNELLSIQPGTHPQQLLDIISELILLGLNPEPVYVALKKSPQLLKLPIMQMRKRSSYLRKLGLGEGKLKRVLHCCPEVFTMRQQDIDSIVRVLKEKCLFTVKQVAEILHRCPCVLREDPTALEYKFQMLHAVTQRWHRTKMPRRTRSTRLTTLAPLPVAPADTARSFLPAFEVRAQAAAALPMGCGPGARRPGTRQNKPALFPCQDQAGRDHGREGSGAPALSKPAAGRRTPGQGPRWT
ncbi:transcription termination factor 4, mitochondrial isoform X9 [Camelus ferus]|uniref:Transcription termination factor 4, mitochondrial isoform X9 n=1 Tax=Camelus ferus TaxID=419612 RepID=A0A8B8T3B1_CAMFR|nr:transcription termination factor 4, mitochondrial isoform X9 [Camelus ferus]